MSPRFHRLLQLISASRSSVSRSRNRGSALQAHTSERSSARLCEPSLCPINLSHRLHSFRDWRDLLLLIVCLGGGCRYFVTGRRGREFSWSARRQLAASESKSSPLGGAGDGRCRSSFVARSTMLRPEGGRWQRKMTNCRRRYCFLQPLCPCRLANTVILSPSAGDN